MTSPGVLTACPLGGAVQGGLQQGRFGGLRKVQGGDPLTILGGVEGSEAAVAVPGVGFRIAVSRVMDVAPAASGGRRGGRQSTVVSEGAQL